MSSHSRVLRSCLVALFVWCVVAERAFAAAAAAASRLSPDERQSDEGEAEHEDSDVHDDGEYEQPYEEEPGLTAEATYDAVTGDENDEEAETDVHTDEHHHRRPDYEQADDFCGTPLLVKLFDLDGDICKGRNHDVYENYEESEEKEGEKYEEFYEY